MLQGGSSASVGGGHAAVTGLYAAGLRWRQLWRGLVSVIEAATVVATGRRGCNGEGVACVCAREMGVTLM